MGKEGLSQGRHFRTRKTSDKRLRARGGCLGTCWRRRTDRPRKSAVSCQKSVDPHVSEWGNPMGVKSHDGGTSEVVSSSRRRELKHLSTSRKRNQVRDPPSSGERNGKSLNRGIYSSGLRDLNMGPDFVVERSGKIGQSG